MKRKMIIFVMLLTVIGSLPLSAERVMTTWNGTAQKMYDNGFIHMLMKDENGGICLFNMDLIQNEAPGAGRSERGVYSDIIWGENGGRKILYLDDPRGHKAFLVFWVYRQRKHPLQFTVNGNKAKCENWKASKSREVYRWVEFPVEWLNKGKNTIDLFSPEAKTPEEG